MTVNIDVLPTVSMWADDASSAWMLKRPRKSRRRGVVTHVINNVDANIQASVSGTAG